MNDSALAGAIDPRSPLTPGRWRARQRGVYVVLFPFVVIALFGVIGLTVTSGNTFVERTKLQTLLDAMALSAATQVNIKNAENDLASPGAKCTAPGSGAEQAMRNAFSYLTADASYASLAAAIDPNQDLLLEYATQLNGAAFSTVCPPTDPTRPIYVRLRLQQLIQTPEFMVQVLRPWLGGDAYDMRIAGSAVAGPVAAMPLWNAQRCPVPAFVCDRSDVTDVLHPPTSGCEGAPNGAGCRYGYAEASTCTFPDPSVSVCSDLQAQLALHTLQLIAGVELFQALTGVSGACPLPPDENGMVTTVISTLPAPGLVSALSVRLLAGQTTIVVPVLDCNAPGTTREMAGYLCIQLSDGVSAPQASVVEAGTVPGGCGAGSVIGGPGARPKEAGLLATFWRIVLLKDPGAIDS